MLPFGVTIPATVPQRSEIPEGLIITLYWHQCSGTWCCVVHSYIRTSTNKLFKSIQLTCKCLYAYMITSTQHGFHSFYSLILRQVHSALQSEFSRVRSSASAFNFQYEYPLLSLRSASSCLCLLPRLPFTSILPSIGLEGSSYATWSKFLRLYA